MSAYKVSVCKSPGWRSVEACTLGVSVTSPNWQDERFASILAFAAAHFKTIRIDVTDLLYRHNFMAEGQPPGDAEARARALGTSWLERHQAVINDCPVKPDVIRWGQWYEQPDYPTVLDSFQSAYRTSRVFRDAVENDVDRFVRRLGRESMPTERQHSRDFLIEEVAVLTLQARELPGLRIYPGDQLACMDVVSRGLVPDAPRGLEREQFAEVNLRTRASLEAAHDRVAVSCPAPGRPDRSNMPPLNTSSRPSVFL
jgi:tRNA-dependent cyclodipeptide synthase